MTMKNLLKASFAAISLAVLTSCVGLNVGAETQYGKVQTNADGSFTFTSKPIPHTTLNKYGTLTTNADGSVNVIIPGTASLLAHDVSDLAVTPTK